MSKIKEPTDEKKKSINPMMIVVIVVGIFLLGFLGYFLLSGNSSTTTTKTTTAKPKTTTTKPATTASTSTVAPATTASTTASTSSTPVNDTNTLDETKTQSTTAKANTTGTYTSEQLKGMTPEQKAKALKDTINNSQPVATKPVLSAEDSAVATLNLPFNTSKLSHKDVGEYANYQKHISKTDDRTFVFYVDLVYDNKPYQWTITPEVWQNLKDSGIVPVSVTYYIDTTNHQNVVAVVPKAP